MNIRECVHKHFEAASSRNQGDGKFRPVVILKPFADTIFDRFIEEFPSKVEIPVPHTTRKRRENELEGREYYFLNQSFEEFMSDCDSGLYVEAGTFNFNAYGTRFDTVTDVIEKGKYPLLPIGGKSVKRLQAFGLDPIVICVALKSCTSNLLQEMGIDLTEDEAKQHAQEEAEEAGHFITDEVEGNTEAELYDKVKEIVFASS